MKTFQIIIKKITDKTNRQSNNLHIFFNQLKYGILKYVNPATNIILVGAIN